MAFLSVVFGRTDVDDVWAALRQYLDKRDPCRENIAGVGKSVRLPRQRSAGHLGANVPLDVLDAGLLAAALIHAVVHS